MVYDHVRSRLWWVASNVIYMYDDKNKQVKSIRPRDRLNNYFVSLTSLDVELKTGNVFVVAVNIHDDSVIIQVDRDNNGSLAEAYIGI